MKIVIAAGGTGGHFFPAEALATELARRGHDLVLMTDRRHGRRDQGVFADRPQYVLDGAGVAGGGLVRKLKGLAALARGTLEARRILATLDADAVVGFGGYPSIPPLLGARFVKGRRPKIIIHEGNAVLGQANALLARFADAVATSYPTVAKIPAGMRTALTGMPVRPAIAALLDAPYVSPTDTPPADIGTFNLLVWGGSLGARIFSDVAPAALAGLPPALRDRLYVTQQVRAEDLERVRAAYDVAGIEARTAPFFDDVPELLSNAHIVIGRAGGSSVAELTLSGRPSILVPLPIAASDEQSANAASLVEAGAAWMFRQQDFTPEALRARLEDLLPHPDRLLAASRAARSLARPNSAILLADLVESTQTVYAASASAPLTP
ncbi:undecaprenyldiphospho-muramoylpentapeptide beta-N-acetylglucosaminyltransferase [Brytella acorum]|uniref:UDP-N-acetylglucosamine--N-acetylmuramyl-(pentapeptide) pyrophosphoryl-undecaprenol N-acetylglucosamine transferase n=2 Tax=Brytella acorum TaxID=2959299 RepID=A0AA35Y2K4_9PROT|nr:undecaprenyldiphospho-muramoylpentapeptide beta-N-acetylglucosaminyltransferase [Brytella acorum]MDF3623550.1 undecaprenyldiphospho-muramoylpentapeptide beta-N-acetylglucosaminyltransferase [Brytella acorum]CAI9121635.1 undecaprenyldiphospho-muramoylpentapeptide beta-N-acetylglucosaminyltransferase [Brytella acorum]